jgi:uroporphyrinogen-III synthase
MKMLVTRPEPDASETAARLAALEIEPVLAPLLEFVPLPARLPPDGFAALAVTSANALRALDAQGATAGLRDLPVYAVGDHTAEAARRLGYATVSSAGGDFGDLVGRLAHEPIAGPILYPAPREATADLARSLAPFGRLVITVQVYAMELAAGIAPQTIRALDTGGIAAALFYSRRTAAHFVALAAGAIGARARRELGVLCLSETVAEPLIDAHFVRIGLAEQASETAMMGLALSFARDQNAS